jgi:GMP synthase (glutamine-hydrolysing)
MAGPHERLLIIDFGSQVTQLIARRLRELNVYCEIHPYQNVTDAFLEEFAPKAVIFSGGPASVIDEGSPRPPRACLRAGRADPRHLLRPAGDDADAGRRGRTRRRHRGIRPRLCHPFGGAADLLTGWFLDGREQVWMSHGDHVSRIAPGFEVYGTSPGAPFAITADLARNFYAVQFHPEVHHTPNGKTLYENFVRLAGSRATGPWAPTATRRSARSAIRWATRR